MSVPEMSMPEPSVAGTPGARIAPREPSNLVVLASGSGSLLQAVLDAAASQPFRVRAAVSDRADTPALARAAASGVPAEVVSLGAYPDRAAWDRALTDTVAAYRPDLVVSAGFMKLLGGEFLTRYPYRVLNSHPALLPAFPGAHAVADALARGVRVTGCTVHLVDAGVDTGPIVDQRPVEVQPGDGEASLHERIKSVERELLISVLARMAREGYTVGEGKVEIS